MKPAGAHENIDLEGYFVYHGRESDIVPEDVIRVRVHPSVKVIKEKAFFLRRQLTTVILNDGLEEIGRDAFSKCTSLQGIDVPPTVKSIKDWAFCQCSTLTTVTLQDGLEEIGKGAFQECTSLQGINVPPMVKSIKDSAFYECSTLTTVILNDGLEEIGIYAFYNCTLLQGINVPPTVKSIEYKAFYQCSQLTTVTLNDGLEEIGGKAFFQCTSLELIGIPPTIKAIHDSAFNGCSRLNRVVFRNEIEEFATCEAMRGWWNQGVHENFVHEETVKTYHFLFRCSIPERLGAIPLQLQANIYEMLRRIPSVLIWDLNAHLESIDSKLTLCDILIEEVLPLLEIVIWKSQSTQRSIQDDDVVILNVFSYMI